MKQTKKKKTPQEIDQPRAENNYFWKREGTNTKITAVKGNIFMATKEFFNLDIYIL